MFSRGRLRELIADAKDEFERISVDLPGNSARFHKQHGSLHNRVAASALMDRKRFARDTENTYRFASVTWCNARMS
jgi:predicted O-linked N-acetylglucosamine transferase (SPINDLY family)